MEKKKDSHTWTRWWLWWGGRGGGGGRGYKVDKWWWKKYNKNKISKKFIWKGTSPRMVKMGLRLTGGLRWSRQWYRWRGECIHPQDKGEKPKYRPALYFIIKVFFVLCQNISSALVILSLSYPLLDVINILFCFLLVFVVDIFVLFLHLILTQL